MISDERLEDIRSTLVKSNTGGEVSNRGYQSDVYQWCVTPESPDLGGLLARFRFEADAIFFAGASTMVYELLLENQRLKEEHEKMRVALLSISDGDYAENSPEDCAYTVLQEMADE